MPTKEKKAIGNRYWFTWGLTSALGIFILLIQLGIYNYRPICSPVVGCGYEVPLFLTILISILLLITRVFRKNKLKLITPQILLVFSVLILIFTFSSEKRFNESMTSLAKDIQELCVTNEQCPVTLSTAFDDVRLVKAGTIYPAAIMLVAFSIISSSTPSRVYTVPALTSRTSSKAVDKVTGHSSFVIHNS